MSTDTLKAKIHDITREMERLGEKVADKEKDLERMKKEMEKLAGKKEELSAELMQALEATKKGEEEKK